MSKVEAAEEIYLCKLFLSFESMGKNSRNYKQLTFYLH